jgi:putative restriction endonuclease
MSGLQLLDGGRRFAALLGYGSDGELSVGKSNQTFRHEQAGGYLWSPKRNANGARNPFYETMCEVSPGDVVFSFNNTRLVAIGITESYCWESPKPEEFGNTGQYWENVGWRVRVRFTQLRHQVRPKDHAEVLIGIIGPEARILVSAGPARSAEHSPLHVGDDLDVWEHRLEQGVEQDQSMPETDREAIIRARRGQGLFKQNVIRIERRCRITGVENLVHLVASHCKPWRDSNNEERINGENGLLLTPSIDHLFDRGFIGFEDNGTLIISPVAHHPSLQRMGIETRKVLNVGEFTEGQRSFLDFHRNAVLLRSSL